MPDWLFTVAWVAVLLWFVVWEGLALWRKRRGDTLSEHVWQWFCLSGPKAGKSRWCIVRRVFFIGFWAWLTLHFVFGGSIV
jgi:hypothetical protein